MQIICLQPSPVTLALFMKHFILHTSCKEEKRVDWCNHHWIFLSFFKILTENVDPEWNVRNLHRCPWKRLLWLIRHWT